MRLFAGTPFDRPPVCARCGALETDCVCPPLPPPPPMRIAPESQVARLSIEKRKQGKVVTLIQGLPAEGNDLPELLSRLKSQCGAGGAVKQDTIEIQGEHRGPVRRTLEQLGYRVKG